MPLHVSSTAYGNITPGCVMKFWPPDDEHMCSKHVEAWNKLIVKQKFFASILVNYWDKYTEMHGQQKEKNLVAELHDYENMGWAWDASSPLCWFNNKEICVFHVQSNTTII